MTKKGKIVTALLTVHKQSLPFRRVTSVTILSLCLWMCRIKGAQSLDTHGTSKRIFLPSSSAQKLRSAVHVETGYVKSVTG